jgi:hypothetical protein
MTLREWGTPSPDNDLVGSVPLEKMQQQLTLVDNRVFGAIPPSMWSNVLTSMTFPAAEGAVFVGQRAVSKLLEARLIPFMRTVDLGNAAGVVPILIQNYCF